MMSDFKKMTRQQLIARLEMLTVASDELLEQARKASVLSQDLYVHKVELEVQNQELMEAQQLLAESRDRYADLYDFSPVGYASLTPKGVIQEINLTAAKMLGRERSYLMGQPFSAFVEKDSLSIFYAHLQHVFSSNGKVTGNVRLRCKGQQPVECSMESIAIVQALNHETICRTALIDISERKALERARFLANFDSLTGLPNRTLLQDRVSQALANAQRNQSRVGMLFLDLNKFKQINDTYGHATGDLLLQEVANRLAHSVRKVDTVARLGGDEFIVLLPELNGGEHAVIAVENILDAMSEVFDMQGHQFKIMPSIGISIYPDDSTDMEGLIRCADAAMYHAKKSSHRNFEFYTPDLNALALEGMTMESKLRLALNQGMLELRYQPQMEIATGRIVGMEALLRWHDADLGWVAPSKIIAVAEDRGLIDQIFDWVLLNACSQIRQWQQAGVSFVPVAVNVSPTQIAQKCFAQSIIQALKKTGLESALLELEITEGAVMHYPELVIDVLGKLKGIGVLLAVDDFGTGYSSLSYLAHLPIQKLKIAEPFVRDLKKNSEASAIIAAIIGMARSLNLRSIAEGVETVEQMEFLRQSGCDEIQGYYLSQPLPVEEFQQFMASRKSLI